jgi:hemolysin activation/secretion protein
VKSSSIVTPAMNSNEEFAAANASYVFQTLNDSILPTKGLSFKIGGDYTDNIGGSQNNVAHYAAETNLYIPISKKFSLKLRAGGATLSGDPQFYQYNKIGGSETLRGHQRDRYQGNSTAYNQNELRFITNLRSKIFNGKIGVFALYDQGRVWLKGETSNKLQSAYGGGIILSPFNRLSVTAAIAGSDEDSNIHIGIMKVF